MNSNMKESASAENLGKKEIVAQSISQENEREEKDRSTVVSGEDVREDRYIDLVIRKFENIRMKVSRRRNPKKSERELIYLIFNKMVDPYYYWAEAKEGKGNGKHERGDSVEPDASTISVLAEEYGLDLSELNKSPSRIKLRKYIDRGFEELSVKLKRMGYSYDRGSRSFVK